MCIVSIMDEYGQSIYWAYAFMQMPRVYMQDFTVWHDIIIQLLS